MVSVKLDFTGARNYLEVKEVVYADVFLEVLDRHGAEEGAKSEDGDTMSEELQ